MVNNGIVTINDSASFEIYKVKSHKKNGLYKQFYKKGNLLIANYKNDVLNGNYSYYNNEGELLFEKKYKNGKQVSFKSNGLKFK